MRRFLSFSFRTFATAVIILLFVTLCIQLLSERKAVVAPEAKKEEVVAGDKGLPADPTKGGKDTKEEGKKDDKKVDPMPLPKVILPPPPMTNWVLVKACLPATEELVKRVQTCAKEIPSLQSELKREYLPLIELLKKSAAASDRDLASLWEKVRSVEVRDPQGLELDARNILESIKLKAKDEKEGLSESELLDLEAMPQWAARTLKIEVTVAMDGTLVVGSKRGPEAPETTLDELKKLEKRVKGLRTAADALLTTETWKFLKVKGANPNHGPNASAWTKQQLGYMMGNPLGDPRLDFLAFMRWKWVQTQVYKAPKDVLEEDFEKWSQGRLIAAGYRSEDFDDAHLRGLSEYTVTMRIQEAYGDSLKGIQGRFAIHFAK